MSSFQSRIEEEIPGTCAPQLQIAGFPSASGLSDSTLTTISILPPKADFHMISGCDDHQTRHRFSGRVPARGSRTSSPSTPSFYVAAGSPGKGRGGVHRRAAAGAVPGGLPAGSELELGRRAAP
ncbi:hypothetical protein THAOC_22492, partial [Thalassiosira oceanica]